MVELNYQELVKDYYENLNNNLRNFKGGPGFLETWVHDEDHNRSLLEILDLAHSNGVASLRIHLPKEVSMGLNLDWLRRSAKDFGSLNLSDDHLDFSTAKDLYQASDFDGIGRPYAAKLSEMAQTIRHEGQPEVKEGLIFSARRISGGELIVRVNEAGSVQEATHMGFRGFERVLMDVFCEILCDRPLQEGAEHGVIRLEAFLRDRTQVHPVKGLLTPENADPSFVLPTQLVREAFSQFLAKTGQDFKRNFWRDPVPSSWLELPYETKLKEAQNLMNAGSRTLGLQEDIQVTEIKNDTRFVLAYNQMPGKPDFGRHMIKLELWLRAQMNFQVELQLESIEDRNRRVERTKRV